MGIRRISWFTEGTYKVEIKEIEIVTYKGGKDAIRIIVTSGNKIGTYLIFMNNTVLVDKFISTQFQMDSINDDEVIDEREFLGCEMYLTFNYSGKYLIITDVISVDDYEDRL